LSVPTNQDMDLTVLNEVSFSVGRANVYEGFTGLICTEVGSSPQEEYIPENQAVRGRFTSVQIRLENPL